MKNIQDFNYHSHTYRCKHADLDMKDEEYIEHYIKMGFKKIAFTDHAPEKNEIDKRQNMRMKYSEKNEYLNNIKKLKEKYKNKIEIESGFEVEYLPGEEENIRELKNDSDKIILGQHFIYDNSKELKIFGETTDFSDEELIRYAKYIEKAIELGLPDIIVHPDIYMYRRRNFGKIEEEVAEIICKAAEKYKIPLEINLCRIFRATYFENKKLNNLPIEEQKRKINNLPYPYKEFWKIVSKYDIKVLYGLDAHYRGQILVWNELIELANEIIGKDIVSKLNFIK